MKKIVVLFFFATAALFAQPRQMRGAGCGPEPGGFGPPGDIILEQLNLNEKQEKQFKGFRSEFEKKNIDLRAKVQTLRISVRDLFDEENPNQDKIEAKLTEISKVQNEMKLNATSFWFAVNSILTAEQQTIWKEHSRMLQERFEERKGPRGAGMPGRGPGMRGAGPGGRGFRQHMNCPMNGQDSSADDPGDQNDPPEKKSDNW